MNRSSYKSLMMGLDPVRLMAAIGMEADPWQRQVLKSESSHIMLMCGRQMGKSTTTAIKALHQALYTNESLVLLISRSQDQSEELFRKISTFYRWLGMPVESVRPPSLSRIELKNGSRIIALPNNADTIRGYSSISMLIVDEASRVPDSVFAAVSPMMAVSQGTEIWLSTPNVENLNGMFVNEWQRSGSEWEKIKAQASQCPRIPAEFLESERRRLGELMYLQEYEAEIVSCGDSVFSLESINRAFVSNVDVMPGF